MNNRQLMITKSKALFALMMPAGISRIAVRGFFASKFLSSQRLKAMAAERAKTMQRMIRSKVSHSDLGLSTLTKSLYELVIAISMVSFAARKKPISAKGIAKMVWANLTRERYFFMAFIECSIINTQYTMLNAEL